MESTETSFSFEPAFSCSEQSSSCASCTPVCHNQRNGGQVSTRGLKTTEGCGSAPIKHLNRHQPRLRLKVNAAVVCILFSTTCTNMQRPRSAPEWQTWDNTTRSPLPNFLSTGVQTARASCNGLGQPRHGEQRVLRDPVVAESLEYAPLTASELPPPSFRIHEHDINACAKNSFNPLRYNSEVEETRSELRGR